jgi:solute carrier family 25 (adenine nucleotide translocator) protein 4/5/6/31
MGGYDTAKSHLHADASVWLRLAVAQAITTGAGTLCFPFDTVKRRLMVQEQQLMVLAAGAATAGPAKYRNGVHCVRVILREEGFFGLYAGLPANLLRGLSGSLLLVGYDEAKKFLQPRQKE